MAGGQPLFEACEETLHKNGQNVVCGFNFTGPLKAVINFETVRLYIF